MSSYRIPKDVFPRFNEPEVPASSVDNPIAEQSLPAIQEHQSPPRGWDNVVAAVRTATKKNQRLLLTLTASNMTPIWMDLYTKRYYTEMDLDHLPEQPESPKLFAKLIDPNDPPFPWVHWKTIDALLWSVGTIAFAHRRARWLVLGERYSLLRWPNLTQISYGPEELNAVSMLANGLLTIDELALVSKITPEKSQQLISTLSFIGVLRGTGVPRMPAKIVEAMNTTGPSSFEELQQTTILTEQSSDEQAPGESLEEENIFDSSAEVALADADHVRSRLERPAISSMSLPELPETLFHRGEPEQEHSEAPEQIDTVEQESVQKEKSYREETASRFSSMPSFESILAQQAVTAKAEASVEESTSSADEKPSGLFGMLKKLRLK